jgi:hypothetical protein
MIDYTESSIEKVSVHSVGNKTNDEELRLSKSLLDTSDIKIRELLMKFFLTPFSNPEYYSFTSANEDFTLNPLFNLISKMFEKPNTFYQNTVDIAKYLYQISVHPQIKSGDLFVAHISDICIEDEITDAIGIFKSENRQSFLKLDNSREEFSINYEDGINIEKLDKGCLIFNTDKNTGYKVCIIDKSSKSTEAQYWKDNFLQLKPCSDDYHHTKEFMNATKNFVTKQLSEEYEMNKADQIDYLNRSMDYFKTHNTFDQNEFEDQVFNDSGVIKSFHDFNQSYQDNYNTDLNSSFGISAMAVNRQSRIFKGVLKLDKNFHIYIHGNSELIEQGVEDDGRKYYKIYYDNES